MLPECFYLIGGRVIVSNSVSLKTDESSCVKPLMDKILTFSPLTVRSVRDEQLSRYRESGLNCSAVQVV